MSHPVPEVRLLPMSGGEFKDKSTKDVQMEYFLNQLPFAQTGRYYYLTSGLTAPAGTIVLFQFANQIIASAVFSEAEQFDEPREGYRGTFNFDPSSIRIFDPVGPEVMHSVWADEFKGFWMVKAYLDPEKFSQFEQKLTGIQAPSQSLTLNQLNDQFDKSVQQAQSDSTEVLMSRLAKASPWPKRIVATGMVFRRNPDVVVAVLRRANGICEECKKPAPFNRKSDGEPYLEVHHKQRLADDGKDSVENAIAVCPNCHRYAHYG